MSPSCVRVEFQALAEDARKAYPTVFRGGSRSVAGFGPAPFHAVGAEQPAALSAAASVAFLELQRAPVRGSNREPQDAAAVRELRGAVEPVDRSVVAEAAERASDAAAVNVPEQSAAWCAVLRAALQASAAVLAAPSAQAAASQWD